jgi:hypothetical protein
VFDTKRYVAKRRSDPCCVLLKLTGPSRVVVHDTDFHLLDTTDQNIAIIPFIHHRHHERREIEFNVTLVFGIAALLGFAVSPWFIPLAYLAPWCVIIDLLCEYCSRQPVSF